MVQFNARACSACHACSVACIDENDLPRGAGRVCAYRRVTEQEKKTEAGYRFLRKMSGCMHCADAPCMAVCPADCFSRDGQTGLILPDNSACLGCRLCAEACPFDAVSFGGNGLMQKCDGCIDRLRAGLRPACEAICPPQALKFL